MLTTFAIGNLVRDAELTNVNVENTPTPRCRFTIAVNKTTRAGKNSVVYVECTAWREYAKAITPYLKKGRQIHVEGEVGINQYTDKTGAIRTNLQLADVKVTLLGKKPEEETGNTVPVEAHAETQATDDGLPF